MRHVQPRNPDRALPTPMKSSRSGTHSAFGSLNMRRLLRQLPTYMILDDHEVEDNWAQDRIRDRKKRMLFNVAIGAYCSYQWTHSPRNFGIAFTTASGDVSVPNTSRKTLSDELRAGIAGLRVSRLALCAGAAGSLSRGRGPTHAVGAGCVTARPAGRHFRGALTHAVYRLCRGGSTPFTRAIQSSP